MWWITFLFQTKSRDFNLKRNPRIVFFWAVKYLCVIPRHGLRYQPCLDLHSHGIPCVVWFEDALGYYGVPTVVFSLYLLTPNIDSAAQVLKEKGWVFSTQPAKIGMASVDSAMHTLTPPGDAHDLASSNLTTTILLPALDWNYSMPDQLTSSSTSASIFPPLPMLVDALIDSLLDTPLETKLSRHLIVQVAYLYGYVTALQIPSFASLLKPDHRQYHFDSLSGMAQGTLRFIAHQRKIREAIRQGEYELQDCSVSRDDEDFFQEKIMARLLASMPPPPSQRSSMEVR